MLINVTIRARRFPDRPTTRNIKLELYGSDGTTHGGGFQPCQVRAARLPYNAFIYLSTLSLARLLRSFFRHLRVINRASRTFLDTLSLEFEEAPAERDESGPRVPDLGKPSINVVGIPLRRIRFFRFFRTTTLRRVELREDLSVGISASFLCAELIRFDTAITQIEASRYPALLYCTNGET